MKECKHVYRRCKRCGRWWNVSVSEKRTKGYACPECAGDEQAGYCDHDGWMKKKGA